jgi:hypothetical protein
MKIPVQTEPLLVGSTGIITFYKDNIKLYVVSLIDYIIQLSQALINPLAVGF